MAGNTSQPIVVPVIADGQNGVAGEVAQFIAQEIARRNGVETALINFSDLASAKLAQADAMVLVVPEHNYGFPNVLKSLRGKTFSKSACRAVGICDLSPGWLRP